MSTAAETEPTLLTEAMREKIRAHFPRYPDKRAVCLPALHIVHDVYRCVPFQAMAEIADLLEITPAEVHDTMSFYGFFPQAPLGDVRVWMCRSISCMLRGGDELLEHACQKLAIEPGQTTIPGEPDRSAAPPLATPKLSERERALLEQMSDRPIAIDEIATAAGLPVQEVLATLPMLELRHLIKRLPGGRFVRS